MITFLALAHMVGATQHHVPCTCTHGRCYASNGMGWVWGRVGWGQGLEHRTIHNERRSFPPALGMIMFLALAHMVGATQHCCMLSRV